MVQSCLEKNVFSIRKQSISQSVPIDWMNIAIEASSVIRTKMKAASVTVLINADEMFLNYYPKEQNLIVPINLKRVGSNRKDVRVKHEKFQKDQPQLRLPDRTRVSRVGRFQLWCLSLLWILPHQCGHAEHVSQTRSFGRRRPTSTRVRLLDQVLCASQQRPGQALTQEEHANS